MNRRFDRRLEGILDTWANEEKVLPEDTEWMLSEIKWLKQEEKWCDECADKKEYISSIKEDLCRTCISILYEEEKE